MRSSNPLRRLIWRTLAALATLVGGVATHTASATEPPARLPASAFFQNPSLAQAVLSPSGQAVAMRVGSADGRERLVVLDLKTMKVTPAASFTDADVVEFRWVNDQRLVFKLGDTRLVLGDQRFAWGLFAVNADGTGFRQLAQREHVWVSDNIGTQQLPWNTFLIDQAGAQEGDEVYVAQPEGRTTQGDSYVQLLRLNTVTGRSREVDTPLHSTQWVVDAQDRVVAAYSAREGTATLHARDPASGQWRALREFNRFAGSGVVNLLAAAPEGRLYVSALGPKRNTMALYLYDPATNALADAPLLASPQFDLHPQLIEREGRLLGARIQVEGWATQWFDADMKAVQTEVDRLLPETSNLISMPRRGNSPWLLVHAFSDMQPGAWLLYHRETRQLTRLGARLPGLNASAMSPMDMVHYPARDGLDIPAYLTLPAGAATKKNLPLIVYVHGGPWLRGASWGWIPEVQFLASRGYAVLMPEFRGSTGFGTRLFRAGFRQWGLAMQDDLVDGARWAVKQGFADARRICIMGGSYGGYATLMGLARDGDVFRCGVSFAGVSDILLMYDARWSDFTDVWRTYGMPRLVGDREKDQAQLEATSPLKLAARIKNPVLIGHGRIDRRVPIEHGRRMFDAVRANHPDNEWVEYDKEGHGWSTAETATDWWSRVEKFLGKQLIAP